MIAQLAEIHRDPKKRSRPFDAAEFHPMRPRKKTPTATYEDLQGMI